MTCIYQLLKSIAIWLGAGLFYAYSPILGELGFFIGLYGFGRLTLIWIGCGGAGAPDNNDYYNDGR